jgi:hypothetical protein
MALKGTLKDFGIADILQLIGQQQKTGVLTLKQRNDTVAVAFHEGNIVRAETASRNRKDLIGSMLVAAGLVTEQQLEFALETQKRTLARLGDVLVTQRVLTNDKFKAMSQLQTSETLFKLFSWKAGHYEFEQKEVEIDNSLTPLRAESVLMEGFRRVDEWPVVRKRITSLEMTFEQVRELPPPVPAKPPKDDFDAAFDDAFAEPKKSVNKGEFQSVGENERKVFGLVAPGRTVQRIIELSTLGEFETAKALCNLINLEFLKGIPAQGRGRSEFDNDSRADVVLGLVGRIGVTMAVLVGLLLAATQVDFRAIRLARTNATTFSDPAAQRFASQHQLSRVIAALQLFKLEKGELPKSLSELVDAQLLAADDVHYPWTEPYFYRKQDDGDFVLLPPLH